MHKKYILIFCMILFVNFGLVSAKDFEVQTTLVKESIVLGGETSAMILVENKADYEQVFSLSSEGLGKEVSFKEEVFVVGAGESKSFEIFLKDVENIVGVYIGYLILENDKSSAKIPLILTVEEEEPLFAILQESLATHKNIYPGGELWVEIKFFDLVQSGVKEIKLNYEIKDFEGNVLFSEKGTKIIENSEVMTKVVSISKDFSKGDYVFITSIGDEEHKYVSVHLFEITSKGIGSFGSAYYLIIIAVFVFGMFGLMYYFIKSRDKFLIELHEQQSKEVRGNLSVLKKYKKEINKIDDIYKKRKKLKELEKKKKAILVKIRKKQKLQKNELAKLIKDKKLGEVKRKLNSWKKQGYSFSEVQKNFKDLSKEKIDKNLGTWKRQGYKF